MDLGGRVESTTQTESFTLPQERERKGKALKELIGLKTNSTSRYIEIAGR